jgi:hypothetical protein
MDGDRVERPLIRVAATEVRLLRALAGEPRDYVHLHCLNILVECRAIEKAQEFSWRLQTINIVWVR